MQPQSIGLMKMEIYRIFGGGIKNE